MDAFGRLDVWVNNVGGSDDKTTLALELAPRIRDNTVAPSPIATEAFLDILNVRDQLDRLAATIPLARLGLPDDIA